MKNNARPTRVVIKQVNSRDEIKEIKEGSYRNKRNIPVEKSSDNIITFDPYSVPAKKIHEKQVQNKKNIRSAQKNQDYQDPLILKNPYHSSAQKRYLFKTNENNNILDSIDEQHNKRKMKS